MATTTAKQPKEELSPMMKQYYDLKEKHPDALLLFRCGDFYETYDEDAQVAHEVLGITLTRSFGKHGKDGHALRMAGFPYTALDTYLPKFIRAGRRVAICDQLEDPKTTKKLVKRGITEIHSPVQDTKQEEQATKVAETSTPKTSTEMTDEKFKELQAQSNEAIASYKEEIEELKKDTHKKLLRMASETIKALGGTLPSTLNAYYTEALGKLELIKVKVQNNAKPTAEEMNYLLSMAEKGESAYSQNKVVA